MSTKETALKPVSRIQIASAIILICGLTLIESCGRSSAREHPADNYRLGLFISTGRGKEMLFHSKKNIDESLRYAKEVGADSIFVHTYIGDNCYFDNGSKTAKSYMRASKEAGQDLLGYLLEKADEHGISCYAWFNTFAFKGKSHSLLKRYGKEVLTKDQHNRYFDGSRESRSMDQYYRRDYLSWLEPGDPRVQEYLLNIMESLVKRYPLLKGVQLDFVRYPNDPPFIPGSRYMKWGYSPGYGKMNITRFRREHKFYPSEKTLSLEQNRKYSGMEQSLIWDDWRREQITDFIKKSNKICINHNKQLTASVFAFADRVYFHGFQDWRGWLNKKLVDFVVLMNYSTDSDMVFHISRQHSSSYPGKIWIALGAYVMKRRPEILKQQLHYMEELKVPGVVLFEYFSIKNSVPLKNVIQNNGSGK